LENGLVVSVICCTYNQEQYIEEALKSFVMQKTSFAYEVLVSDDASQDGTARIIRRYERDYPEIIRPVYFTENQYSKGNSPYLTLSKMARGRYIALCEGDDYWISDDKLQKQYEALEAYPECDMCAHGALLVRASDRKTIGTVEPRQGDGILTMEEVITGGGNFIATNSLFFRASLLRQPARFAARYHIDYAAQMNGAMRGGIYYLHDIMSAYRRGAEQSWTLYMQKNREVMARHIRTMTDMLGMVDEDTQFRFSDSIAKACRKYEFQLARVEGDIRKVYSREFADIRKAMSLKDRTILFLESFAPWTLRLRQKARRH
jgi:glycosyltransferase involved in cell wall biosynthesis